ncbi:hypothetical protein [Bacillus stratosphericus]|nr:hypothetical protein [Bacillus stratosphericus]
MPSHIFIEMGSDAVIKVKRLYNYGFTTKQYIDYRLQWCHCRGLFA